MAKPSGGTRSVNSSNAASSRSNGGGYNQDSWKTMSSSELNQLRKSAFRQFGEDSDEYNFFEASYNLARRRESLESSYDYSKDRVDLRDRSKKDLDDFLNTDSDYMFSGEKELVKRLSKSKKIRKL